MTSPEECDSLVSIRPFVPALDLAKSMNFYERLGFTATTLSESLALLRQGPNEILLQHFELEAFSQNYMLQLVVADLDAWWESLESQYLPAHFSVRAPIAPTVQEWGLRVGYVFDPSGVLLHISEAVEASATA